MHPLTSLLAIALILIVYGSVLDSFILSYAKPETFLVLYISTMFVLTLLTWKMFAIYVAYSSVLIAIGTKFWNEDWRKRGKFYFIFILIGGLIYVYKNTYAFL